MLQVVSQIGSGERRDGDDQIVLRLRAMSEEAAHLASALSAVAMSAPPPDEDGEAPAPRAGRARSPEQVLKLLIEIRRIRFRHFSGSSFTDPGWDMLLDLSLADLEGRPVPVSSACVAAGVPATTALRWVNVLEEAGLVRRVADATDRRRVLLEMTEDGRRRMTVYLRSIARLLS